MKSLVRGHEIPTSKRVAMRILVVAVAYFGAAKLGLVATELHGHAALLWPAAGIALAALLRWGPRVWPGITIGALAAIMSATPPSIAALTIAAGNTAAAVSAYYLLRAARFSVDLARFRDALALVFLGALGCGLISATVGSLASANSTESVTHLWPTWWIWWSGDAIGVLIVVPLVLASRMIRLPRHVHWWQWVEAISFLLATVLVLYLATRTTQHLLFLAFPLLVWVALRCQHVGATLFAIVASIMAIQAAAGGHGLFDHVNPHQEIISLQAFNGSVAITALLLATITVERNKAQTAVQEACTKLAAVVGKYPPAEARLQGRLRKTMTEAQRRAGSQSDLPA